jgi:Cu(I)/Ag(I) efflux system membrane fusion protein
MIQAARVAAKLAVPLLLLVAAVVVVVYWPRGAGTATTGEQAWTCSMHPQVRLPAPGRCPICGMELIPIAQLADAQARLEATAGLETAAVAYRELFKELNTSGKLDFAERQVAYIPARIDGRIERVYVDVAGVPVNARDHLVEIYSPALYTGQAELIQALEAAERATRDRPSAEASLERVRTKLRLLGLLPEQIAEIEQTRQPTTDLTIYSPLGGTVIEKNVREGQYVERGDILYRIANLDPLWLYLDVYESDLAWVRYGQHVDVSVEAYPLDTFHGTVVLIDPFLNDITRTVKVRVNLANADGRLKPAMYASASIRVRLRPDGSPEPTGVEGKFICSMHPEVVQEEAGQCPICEMDLERVPGLPPPRESAVDSDPTADRPQGQVLAVPSSAVLDTGRRKIAYRKTASGAYELIEVRVGSRSESTERPGDTFYPVLDGLQAGDEVVVRGGFLLDSQRQIEGMPSLLYPEGRSAASLHAEHGGGGASPSMPPTDENHRH